jgi:hypothetical protein
MDLCLGPILEGLEPLPLKLTPLNLTQLLQ